MTSSDSSQRRGRWTPKLLASLAAALLGTAVLAGAVVTTWQTVKARPGTHRCGMGVRESVSTTDRTAADQVELLTWMKAVSLAERFGAVAGRADRDVTVG